MSGPAADNPVQQSRPVQRRKVVGIARSITPSRWCTNMTDQVDSDDEDEGSEADATPAPRKAATKRRRLDRSVPSTCELS